MLTDRRNEEEVAYLYPEQQGAAFRDTIARLDGIDPPDTCKAFLSHHQTLTFRRVHLPLIVRCAIIGDEEN